MQLIAGIIPAVQDMFAAAGTLACLKVLRTAETARLVQLG